jgi:hypothetical protein
MSPLAWFAFVIMPLGVCALGWGAVLLNEWHNKRQDARARSKGPHQPLAPEDARLVSEATLQAAAHLGLSDPVLATILGLSATSVERTRDNKMPLIQDQLTLERAAPLLRLSQVFNLGLGDNPEATENWMRSHNSALGARPIDVLQTAGGMERILEHVQAVLGSP